MTGSTSPWRRLGKAALLILVTLLVAAVFGWAAYRLTVRHPGTKAAAPAPVQTTVPAASVDQGPIYYTNEVVVLMYHDISAAKKPGDVITPQTFAGELALFQKDNFHPVTDRQLADFLDHRGTVPPNAVLITFDNGYESFYRTAYPLLKQYHDPATLFVIVSWLDPPYRHGIFQSLTWDQVREMYHSGLVSIQSQTYDLHQAVAVGPNATSAASVGRVWNPATGQTETLDQYRSRVGADVTRARQVLQTQLGEPDVDSLCYPFGDYTPDFIQVLHQAGYRYLYTAKIGRAVLPTTSPDTIFRINSGTPGITPRGLVDTIVAVARQSARTPSWQPPERFVEVWH